MPAKSNEFTSRLEQGEGVEEVKSGADHACLVWKGDNVGCKKRVKGEKWGCYRNEKRKLFITRMFIYVRKKADALFSRTPAFSSSNKLEFSMIGCLSNVVSKRNFSVEIYCKRKDTCFIV